MAVKATAVYIRAPSSSLRWREAEAQATFYFKDKRNRDADNLLASLKPAFDGIADAGVVVNDCGLHHKPVKRSVDKNDPRVVIVIRPLAP